MSKLRPKEARRIFSALRIGIPPQTGVQHYTTDEVSKFLNRFVRDADLDIEDSSIIRFIYGDYGSGKTHFLRLQKEALLDADYAVCLLEMKEHENSIGQLNYMAVRIFESIQSRSQDDKSQGIMHFISSIKDENDINDFKKKHKFDMTINRDLITAIEQIYNFDNLEQKDSNALIAWFKGNPNRADISKLSIKEEITKRNADEIISTLGKIVISFGFTGLAILIDEAEKTTSSFTLNQAKHAYNNLLTLVNTLEKREGIMFIFATTPDFFGAAVVSGKKGDKSLNINPALKSRLGKIPQKRPRPSQIIWNIEEFSRDSEILTTVFDKIITIFDLSYPDSTIDDNERAKILTKMAEFLKENAVVYGKRLRPYIKFLSNYLVETYTDEDLEEDEQKEDDPQFAALKNKFQE